MQIRNIYNIKVTNSLNNRIGSLYNQSMKDLREFYELNWIENTPSLLLVSSRAEYDKLIGHKSAAWVVGNALSGNSIVVFSPPAYGKESAHVYSSREYSFLIKHELSHLFYRILTGDSGPIWLGEGTAIYTSGELAHRKRPRALKHFLRDDCEPSRQIYRESGFVIETLIKIRSKRAFLEFLQQTKYTPDRKSFEEMFKKHYGFPLTAGNMNSLYASSRHKR